MILSPRSPLSVALAALGLAAASCAGPFAAPPFTLFYCEGEHPQPIHCDCTRAPREVAGGRVGRVDVREYDRTGVLKRRYHQGRDLQFVLADRWLVISVLSRQDTPTSMQSWLQCGDVIIPGEIVGRTIHRDASGVHEHEFLALFSAAPGPDDTPLCDMHVALADPGGSTLTHHSENVYLVGRARRSESIAGLTWGVTLADDPAPTTAEIRATQEPPPPPPPPRLCRSRE